MFSVAHEAAFEAGYLHRDISAGNILIYLKNDGKGTIVRVGILADWELAKRLDDNSKDARQPDRTVSTISSLGCVSCLRDIGNLAIHVMLATAQSGEIA